MLSSRQALPSLWARTGQQAICPITIRIVIDFRLGCATNRFGNDSDRKTGDMVVQVNRTSVIEPRHQRAGLAGEHPDVVVSDMLGRPRPAGKVIVVANEKGGVGKSTVAFHLAVALADAGYRIAAIDLDARQRTLSSALLNRDATARRLGVELPQPRHHVLTVQSGAMLCQELARLGWDSDFFILDAPGHDGAMVRRALAIADHLITPVNGSFVDLDLLARLHPTDRTMTEPGCFAETVTGIRASRARHGLAPLDWQVLQNRYRKCNSHNQRDIDDALRHLAPLLDFNICPGWPERVAYRELFLLGLTSMDLKRIPALARTRVRTNAEIEQLVATLIPADPRADIAISADASTPLLDEPFDERVAA
jgi:chromosome partitioning protein